MKSKIIAVIPARYESTRFQGKVLANDSGKFLIQHTYDQVSKAKLVQDVIIAADSEKIAQACESFGAACVMTSQAHQSGTDRIAEAVNHLKVDIIVNIQADEPEIAPANIDLLAQLLLDNPEVEMATLVAKFDKKEQIANPNIVKVVIDKNGFAKYFSRSVIPYDRNASGAGAGGVGGVADYYRHLGSYAYRKEFLLKITGLKQTMLEKTEKLEQLRVLEYGYPILTALVSHIADGIDTPQQYVEFVKRQKEVIRK
ncbi:MAG: 3-deoxy-manno-octulosonate cytidylyltransferase [Planctomycetes bacterium]|nr:3-deoxy-manno-octulosonate cytidylyltransferase [Planctomycetota bacterium]